MFTGIVTHLAEVLTVRPQGAGMRLGVRIGHALACRPGDSIALDGVCLTAVAVGREDFEFDVVRETLERTTLGAARPGDRLNVEFALRAGDPLGGHFVQGHVDAVGEITAREGREGEVAVRIRVPAWVAAQIVPKGSIAVDGVSLTVVEAEQDWFRVALIPATLERTTLGRKGPGARVNIETDILGKYVRRFLEQAAH